MIKKIETEIVLRGRQNNQCWFSPTMAVIPPKKEGDCPEIHVGVWQLTGNDIGPQHWIRTGDLGRTWSPPMESQNLLGIPREEEVFEKPLFWLFHHRRSGRLLAIGSTHFMRDAGRESGYKMEAIDCGGPARLRSNTLGWSEWDFKRGDFRPWKPLAMSPHIRKYHRVWPRAQFEAEDGSILVPMYGRENAESPFMTVVVARMTIGENELQLTELGGVLRNDSARGLAEPSLLRFEGKFYISIRHDNCSYAAVSDDGLHYSPLRQWTFEDGSELENYNTQQHFMACGKSLYLVYNRRSELNNGVFRSRAPLFIAEVDPDRLCVKRKTEQIVFPEKGARTCNFTVANVTSKEAWIMSGEWLQRKDPDIKPGDRFFYPGDDCNRIQYLGDLLLARLYF